VHSQRSYCFDNFRFSKITVGNQIVCQFFEIQIIFFDNLAIIMQQIDLFWLWRLNGIQVKSGILDSIHSGKTTNVQAPFRLACAARPIHPKSVSFLTAFVDVTWVKSHDTFCDTFFNHCQIEFLKIKLVFKINSEILFAFFWKTLHL